VVAQSSLRIDRWLFFTRFYKTRSLATEAVAAGHVKVNGQKATPGHRVKCDDQIELVRDRLLFSMTVLNIPARRGPAKEARSCFDEDEDSVRQREQTSAALRRDRLAMPRTDGRPDKHTRRKLRDRNRNV
jgi:ribosome-associated heat shock protein Hsp15